MLAQQGALFSSRLLKNLDFHVGAKTTRLSGLMVVACYCRHPPPHSRTAPAA